MTLKRRPEAVFVWGINDWTGFFSQLLGEAGIAVSGYVSEDHEGDRYMARPVHREADFAALQAAAGGTPVVVATRSADGKSPAFETGVSAIVNKWALDCPVLNPAFIKHHVKIRFPAGLAVLGFPSSGNTVFGSIAAALFAEKIEPGLPEVDIKTNFVRVLCDEHMGQIADALFIAARGVGSWIAQPRAVGVNEFDLALSAGAYRPNPGERAFPAERFLHVCGARAFTHVSVQRFESHQIPTPALLDELGQLNYSGLLLCRHPLDVLVSLAAKYWRPPGPVLANLAWFESQARALRTWLEAAGRARGRLKLLRYEDLLEKPPETIRELANALDLEITTAEAEALAERYLFRTLQAPGSASALFEPGHMWQPSAGKWRQHLGPAHAAILHRLDYAELLGEFGYESDFAAVLAAQETAPEGTEPDPAWLAWYDFTTHRTQGLGRGVHGARVQALAHQGHRLAGLRQRRRTGGVAHPLAGHALLAGLSRIDLSGGRHLIRRPGVAPPRRENVNPGEARNSPGWLRKSWDRSCSVLRSSWRGLFVALPCPQPA